MLTARQLVHLRTAGADAVPAYVIHPNAPGVKAFTNAGVSVVEEYDAQPVNGASELFIPMRLRLPHGVWKEASGAYVFFSRDRCPLGRIDAKGNAQWLLPWQHVESQGESTLWDDSNAPWQSSAMRKKLEKMLVDRGLVGMPALAWALEIFFQHTCDDVREAVRHMVPAGAEAVAAEFAA